MNEPEIQTDLEPDVVLWRYLDGSKFLDLIESGQLYLSSLNKFVDTNEGKQQHAEVEQIIQNERRFLDWISKGKLKTGAVQRAFIEEREKIWSQRLRNKAFCSCWHEAEFESPRMWRAYSSGKLEEAVAIRTTASRLKDSLDFSKLSNYCGCILNRVSYGDFGQETSEGLIKRALFKDRDQFEFEKEVRLLYWENFHVEPTGTQTFRRVPVDLDKLVEKIVVAPLSSKSRYEEICQLTTLPIIASNLKIYRA